MILFLFPLRKQKADYIAPPFARFTAYWKTYPHFIMYIEWIRIRMISQHISLIPLTIPRLSDSTEDEASDALTSLDRAAVLPGYSPAGLGGAASALPILSRAPFAEPQTPPRWRCPLDACSVPYDPGRSSKVREHRAPPADSHDPSRSLHYLTGQEAYAPSQRGCSHYRRGNRSVQCRCPRGIQNHHRIHYLQSYVSQSELMAVVLWGSNLQFCSLDGRECDQEGGWPWLSGYRC